MKYILLFLLFTVSNTFYGQNSDEMENPFHQIPEYPDNYDSGNIVSRLIDGLGYRFYWATKDLTDNDMTYKPSDDGKSTLETLEHIHGLSKTILNGCQNKANIRPAEPEEEMTFEEIRLKTLDNFMAAREATLNKTAEDMLELKIIFQRGENKNEFEFWHMINGPIADALYHTGQIVAFRRASGNPTPPGVNVFMGKTKE